MTYDFSFERKSVAALVAAAALLCALLFFTGMMVGMGWGTKEDSRAADASAPAAPRASARTIFSGAPAATTRPAAAQTAPPAVTYALPQEPVLYDDPARREYAAEGYGTRPYDAQPYGGAQGYAAQGQGYDAQGQGYAAQGGARRDYAEQEGSAAQGYAPPQRYAARGAAVDAPSTSDSAPQQSAATGRNEAARLSARNIDPDPRLVQEADASADAATNVNARTASSSYSVQVGAYLEEGEAQRIARELENKGYTPKVFSGLDAEARTWYAVRIGSYTSAREAGTAASNFSKQEGRRAAVRPAGSL